MGMGDGNGNGWTLLIVFRRQLHGMFCLEKYEFSISHLGSSWSQGAQYMREYIEWPV